MIARALLLGALLTVTLGVSNTGGSPAVIPGRSAAQRVAPADTPLNLVETPDGFLISTNSGYVTHYLQALDEAQYKVTDRREVNNLWYGLAYEPAQKSLVASTGARSALVIPLSSGKFGDPGEISFDHCELTAGVAIQDQTSAVVACNRSLRSSGLTS